MEAEGVLGMTESTENYKKSLSHIVWTDQTYEEYKRLISSLITTIESQAWDLSLRDKTIAEQTEELDGVREDLSQTEDQLTEAKTLIEFQGEEIERLKLQIKRAYSSLTWSNTENQVPHAIHHLEKAVPVEIDDPEYLEAARIFMQEGENK